MARKPKKRRGTYGDGSVYQRGPTWWVKLPMGGGKPLRKSADTTDREVALELLAKMRRERNRGELVPIDASGAAMTIGDVIDEYLERKKGKLGEATLETYRGQAKRLKKSFALLPVPKLTTDMMSDYRKERRKEEIECGSNAKPGNRVVHRFVTDSTINRELALLRAALRDMHKRYPKRVGQLPHFPMEKEADPRQGFLDETALRDKLLPELPRHLKLLAICAFYAAGRKSEWLRVEWTDVDFERMVIHFPKTKNKHPRDVPIVEGLMLDALLDELKIHNAMYPHLAALFVYDMHPLKVVGKAWRKACTRAGVPDLLIHDVRRSAVRNMRRKGVSDQVAMKISGHLTRSMLDRYSIVGDEDVQEAAQKIAAPLPAPKKLKRLG